MYMKAAMLNRYRKKANHPSMIQTVGELVDEKDGEIFLHRDRPKRYESNTISRMQIESISMYRDYHTLL